VRRVVADLDAYTGAAEALRDHLDRVVAWNTEDREILLAGTPIGDSMRRADSATRSRTLTRALEEFEQARRAPRASVTAAMLDDGATVSEVGDAFGVSRQLAHRFARDPGSAQPVE
jgi:hypothetical protein